MSTDNIIPIMGQIRHEKEHNIQGTIMAHSVFNNGIHAELIYLIDPNNVCKQYYDLPSMVFMGIWHHEAEGIPE